MKILCSKNSQLQSLHLLEFALSIQTYYEQSVRDFLIFILRYSVFTETDQKSRILYDENRAQFSVKYAIRETPVNFQDAWGLAAGDKSSKTQVKGDIYLGVTGNIVGGLGVDVSVVIVIDLDSPLESGLNISGGIAAGVSIGAGICGGYTSGDIEGKTAVTGSVSTPVPGLSLIAAVSEDGSPTIGGAVGPGLGFDISKQNSMTISVNSVVEPIVEGAKVVLKKVADAALKTIDSALDNFR